jgi:cytochrome c553
MRRRDLTPPVRRRQEHSVQHRFVAVLVAIVAVVASASIAQGAPPDAARDLAASCAGCHGTDGASRGAIPILAGMDAQAIVDRMQEFKAVTRPGTVMLQLAKGYTEAEIALIAGWYAAQKAPK